MTGRTRRDSSSSVETRDPRAIHWRQESSVLHSVAKTEPSDNWPIFQLRDAIVLNRDGTTVENALNVVSNGPFIVRGQLHYTKEEKRLVLVRERSPIPIEIRHCLLYSVGETECGSPQIWVSGRAGWFEISPCAAYQATYNMMCQATTLYYSIMDIISDMPAKPRKKSKSPSTIDSLAPIFHKYAAFIGDGSTYEDIVDRCNKHAIFLISQFFQEDIDWKSTEFYHWLKSHNEELFQKVETARQNPRQRTRSPSFLAPPPRASTSISRKSASIEEISEETYKSQTSRPSSSNSTQKTTIAMHPRRTDAPPGETATPPSPPAEIVTGPDSPFATVLAAVEACFDSLLPSKKPVTVSALLNKLYFQYRFPTYRDSTSGSHKRPVEETLHYNAAALLEAIDAEKYKNGEVYDWLQELANKKFAPVAMKPSALPFRILTREQRGFHSRKSETKLESTRPHNSSVRTPSPATPRMGKRPGRPVGSKSSLRPIKSTGKRARQIVEEDDSETDSVAKKLQFLSDRDGDELMADAGNHSSPEEELNSGLQVDESSTSSSEDEAAVEDEERPVKLTILAEKLPDPMPTGYQGTWVCEQQDCDFIARGGDDDELDNRISAHLHEHEQLINRVQLAVAESRGLLPINHLLDKLKQIGEGAHGPRDTQGNIAPRPIKRNLFV